MDDLIPKVIATAALKAIKHGLWEIDIPSPGNCPEYQEHHEQIKNMMEIVDLWIDRIKCIQMEEHNENLPGETPRKAAGRRLQKGSHDKP